MNKDKEKNESDYKTIKNKLLSKAYNNKVFKGKVITIKPPFVIFNENSYFDIFFTKTENPNYCNLTSKKSRIFVKSKYCKNIKLIIYKNIRLVNKVFKF